MDHGGNSDSRIGWQSIAPPWQRHRFGGCAVRSANHSRRRVQMCWFIRCPRFCRSGEADERTYYCSADASSKQSGQPRGTFLVRNGTREVATWRAWVRWTSHCVMQLLNGSCRKTASMPRAITRFENVTRDFQHDRLRVDGRSRRLRCPPGLFKKMFAA